MNGAPAVPLAMKGLVITGARTPVPLAGMVELPRLEAIVRFAL